MSVNISILVSVLHYFLFKFSNEYYSLVGLGTVAGHLAADPEAVVLWVDAHADINTVSR